MKNKQQSPFAIKLGASMLSTILSIVLYWFVVVLCLTFDQKHDQTGYYVIFGAFADVAKNYFVGKLFLTAEEEK